ncbi:threonine/serine exporter family protein [Mycolicibacterium sp. 050158]|uniref:threonine/serine exporter family protein n=1 Tax=Mycolicibacterium sp. 050158 TaxID=3090602 RepID=UPI00299D1CE8|nr:threonine/serine exporter family protein [Mycolicibacterium sp. 050158]MDX1892142.1 threonine/serine exporter family protein [Mycolicibacterium sp. 050158]
MGGEVQTGAPVDPLDVVLDAVVLLHVDAQSTGMTLTAVDRLNRGFGTEATLVPSWPALQLIGSDGSVRVAGVSPTAVNMRRVATAMAAIDAAQDGPLDPVDVRRQLTAAQREPVSNTWLFATACATGAGALAVLFGTHDPLTVAIVALSAALGGLARRGVDRLGGGILTQAFTAALVAGLGGVAAHHVGIPDALGLVVLCPAMVLVPGPHILNGALDLLALRITLGLGRLGYAALILVAIATGLILGVAAGGLTISVAQPATSVPLWVDVIAAGVAAGSYPVFFSMPYRMIGWPVGFGMLAHAAHWWLLGIGRVDLATAGLVSCLIIGALLVPVSHRLRIPFAAIGFASVVAMVPGVFVFRMLSGLVQFASAPSPELLTSLCSDGAVAVLVIAGLATGLAVPMHAYAVFSAASDKRRI